jgi:hypothetical protein
MSPLLIVWVKEELESEVNSWNQGRRGVVTGCQNNKKKKEENRPEEEEDATEIYTRSLLKNMR